MATALNDKVSVMYTLDGASDRERRRSGKLLTYDGRLGQVRLAIKEPPLPAQTTLFSLVPDGTLN